MMEKVGINGRLLHYTVNQESLIEIIVPDRGIGGPPGVMGNPNNNFSKSLLRELNNSSTSLADAASRSPVDSSAKKKVGSGVPHAFQS